MINSIVTCVWCHQQNRVPETWTPAKKLRCGRCQGPIAPTVVDADDDDADDDAEGFDLESEQE